jgi:IS30 family transposase
MKAVTEGRDAQIRELKEMGFSIREIEKELGVSKSAVGRALKRLNGAANGHAG